MTRVLIDLRHPKNGAITKNALVNKLLGRSNDRYHCYLYGGWLWQIDREITSWLTEQCKSPYSLHTVPKHTEIPASTPAEFYLDFEDDREAVLFKLTWGGQ